MSKNMLKLKHPITEGDIMQANFTLIFYPQVTGYTVKCPEIPNCVTEGDTIEEAKSNITALIKQLYDLSNDEQKETIKIFAVDKKMIANYSMEI